MNEFSSDSPQTEDHRAFSQAPEHPEQVFDYLAGLRAREQSLFKELAAFTRETAEAMRETRAIVSELQRRIGAIELENSKLRQNLEDIGATVRASAAQPIAAVLSPEAAEIATPLPLGESPQALAPHETETEFVTTPSTQEPHGVASVPSPPPADSAAAPFTLEELRLIQRHFNESPFTQKTKSVRRSLGRPLVSIVRARTTEPAVLLTVAWDIVWYQYLVSLDVELAPEDRVTLNDEGMELEELAPEHRLDNANLDEQGRLDASELEVDLLGTDTPLLDDLTAEEAAALDDATQEIWNQHANPEFRWDE